MSNELISPVVIFGYNRLEHLAKTITTLEENSIAIDTSITVRIDGPKNENDKVEQVKISSYLEQKKSSHKFKAFDFIMNSKNKGLAESIIAGVSDELKISDRIIVLEDDMVSSPYFLKFMNDGLIKYRENDRVISIHGYCYPVKEELAESFFLKGADCWGWATWRSEWDLFEPNGKKLLSSLEAQNKINEFDFNGTYDFSGMLKKQIRGENDSWAIRWYASAFLADKLTLYPGKSLIQNTGNDASGTHCGDADEFDVELFQRSIEQFPEEVVVDEDALLSFSHFFRSQGGANSKSFYGRVKRKLKRLLNGHI